MFFSMASLESNKKQSQGDKMKLFSIMIALTFSQITMADSFTIIRDNTEYRCESTTPSNPIGSIDCADKAYSGPFTRDEATSLCRGARNVAPADCAIKAYAGPYSKAESIEMCKAQPMLVLRSLSLIEQSADLKEKVARIKKTINLK
jgi:hypothetical protein